MRSTSTGNSAPETAVGGLAVIAPKASERRARAGPVRREILRPARGDQRRPQLRGAQVGALLDELGGDHGHARGGDRAAADHDGLAAVAGGERARRRPRGRAWAGRRRSGPATLLGEIARGGRGVGARRALGVAERDRRAGLGLRAAWLAGSPVTPITGTAERPGGHRRQRLCRRARRSRPPAPRPPRRPRPGRRGLAPALTITTLSRMRVRALAERRRCRCRSPGRRSGRSGGGSPASTAASASFSPSSVSSVRGCGSRPVERADRERVARRRGRADRAAAGRRGALVARGGDHERAEPGRRRRRPRPRASW